MIQIVFPIQFKFKNSLLLPIYTVLVIHAFIFLKVQCHTYITHVHTCQATPWCYRKWWRRNMELYFESLALCERKPQRDGCLEFLRVVRLNKLLNKLTTKLPVNLNAMPLMWVHSTLLFKSYRLFGNAKCSIEILNINLKSCMLSA